MSIFDTHGEKARKALADSVSHQALAIANHEAHRLAPADPGDFTAIKEWDATDANLARDVDIAAGVVEHWRSVVARLDKEAAKKAAIALHADMERRGEAGKKRVRAIAATIDRLASEFPWLRAEQDAFAEYNARRGDLPFVPDSETRVREIPGRTLPAGHRDEVIWQDGAGNQPSVFREVGGELVPIERGFTRKVVRVRISPERVIPTTMPPRLVDAIHLVGLDGKSL